MNVPKPEPPVIPLAHMRALISLVKLARPAQWAKNIFVFTALIFSGLVLDREAILDALIAFGVFSLASSSIYFFNDFKDIEEDKLHGKKRSRPLAAGDLPKWVGLVGFVVLAVGSSLILQVTLGNTSTIILITYILINIAYSMGMKNLVIIDVLIISSGFTLRILAGAAAISRMPSQWLILCAVTVSLLLGFAKRRAEVTALGDGAERHRKVLAQYSESFLDQAISIATAATVVCYILYTVDDGTVEVVGSRLLVFSVPFVLYGIFRYLHLVYHDRSGGDPTRTIFTDVPMLVTGSLWAALCTVVVLFGDEIMSFMKRVN